MQKLMKQMQKAQAAQAEIQEAFRQTLSKMGYRVFLVGDAERAAERHRESPPDAVIFDADGLGPEALAAFAEMNDQAREGGRDLAALVLLGPRQRALRAQIPAGGKITVLDKPVKMKQVQSAIEKLLPLK